MPKTRRRGGRPRPRVERLEGRIVMDASATIGADGLLMIEVADGDATRLVVSESGGTAVIATAPGDGDRIDLVANAAGLTATGSGTGELRVSGITGLKFAVGPGSKVDLTAASVHISFALRPATAYTVTDAGIATSAGENIVSFAGLTADDAVELVAAPWSTFVVDAPAPGGPALRLVGAAGVATAFDVRRTAEPVHIVPGSGSDAIRLGADGSTAGILADVTIGPDSPAEWRANVTVDDAGGAAARDARFAAGDDGPLLPAVLSGALAGDARVLLVRGFTGKLYHRAPAGKDNVMTVDLDGRSPFTDESLIVPLEWPIANIGTQLVYDGGSGAASRLVVVGRPQGPNFMTQRSFAAYWNGGATLSYAYWGVEATGRAWIDSSGVAEIVDLVPTEYYSFEYWGKTPSPQVLIRDGAVEGGFQTLRFESRTDPSAFVPMSIANKADVSSSTSPVWTPLAEVLDYRAEAPVAGLSRLQLKQDGTIVAAPPGADATISVPWFTPEPLPEDLPPPPTHDPAPPEWRPIDPPPTPGQPVDPPIPGQPIEPIPPPSPDVVPQPGFFIIGRFGGTLRQGPSFATTQAADAPRRTVQQPGTNRFATLRAERLAAFRAQRQARLQWLRSSRGA